MMYRVTMILSLFCCSILIAGCSAIFSEQEWSENYALLEGTQATSPQMIDGSQTTVGETTFPAGSEMFVGSSPPSEVVITLPEKKIIRRIVIHANNLKTFDVYADKGGILADSDWQMIADVKSVKTNPIKISVMVPFPTDRIRLRVLSTEDDAMLRRRNSARYAGRVRVLGENQRAPGKIREIELYGYKTAAQVEAEEASESREKELDDLLELE